MCNDPQTDPVTVLEYLQQEQSKRISDYPTYEDHFDRIGEVILKLEAFTPREQTTPTPIVAKQSRWRRK